MVLTPSAMVALGTPAPDFDLPDFDGRRVRKADFQGKPLLVVFLCNHCPYVKHIAPELARVTQRLHDKGIAVVGINSNDAERYPEDSPAMMRREAREREYNFPYLVDETQEVARRYQATCTPDFFLFDATHQLVYRGQFDDARPGNGRDVTGIDLTMAADAMRSGRQEARTQIPSMGCNIKWRS